MLDKGNHHTKHRAEEYLMLFKSTSDEVEDAVTSFRRLSGGKLAYRKDLKNVG